MRRDVCRLKRRLSNTFEVHVGNFRHLSYYVTDMKAVRCWKKRALHASAVLIASLIPSSLFAANMRNI